MATKNPDIQARRLSGRAVIPPSLEKRLARIEGLLLEMRSDQDLVLKRLAKTQAQLDALATIAT